MVFKRCCEIGNPDRTSFKPQRLEKLFQRSFPWFRCLNHCSSPQDDRQTAACLSLTINQVVVALERASEEQLHRRWCKAYNIQQSLFSALLRMFGLFPSSAPEKSESTLLTMTKQNQSTASSAIYPVSALKLYSKVSNQGHTSNKKLGLLSLVRNSQNWPLPTALFH